MGSRRLTGWRCAQPYTGHPTTHPNCIHWWCSSYVRNSGTAVIQRVLVVLALANTEVAHIHSKQYSNWTWLAPTIRSPLQNPRAWPFPHTVHIGDIKIKLIGIVKHNFFLLWNKHVKYCVRGSKLGSLTCSEVQMRFWRRRGNGGKGGARGKVEP
jgi:hypothetical protein